MSKKTEKAKRQAEARRLLGLDEDLQSGAEGAGSTIAPEPTVSKTAPTTVHPTAPDSKPAKKSTGVGHVRTEVNPKLFPKRWKPGDFKRGDSCWYRGERYFIEWVAPTSWAQGTHVRISSKPVHPDPARPLPSDTDAPDLTSFCVHADLLNQAAPVAYGTALIDGGDTLAEAERKERAKKGITDKDDDVAHLLRESKDIYATGSKYLGVPEQELKKKYGHLNPGQQRMNIGNRMRAKWKKDHK